MIVTPELKHRSKMVGILSAVAAGAIGLAALIGPRIVHNIDASKERSAAAFRDTGGSDIERVEGTNIYSATLNGSAGEASSKKVVIDRALVEIARRNPGCEVSTPWQLPMTAGSNLPNQVEEVYYFSIHCPNRVAN